MNTELFFVVQKEHRYDGVYYRLQIVNKAGVPPYPPYLPDPPVFLKGDEFRNLLLTKCKSHADIFTNLSMTRVIQ